jgi:serine/threonine-protein kinase
VVLLLAVGVLILLRVATLSVLRLRVLEVIMIGGCVTYTIVENQVPPDSPVPVNLLRETMGFDLLLWFAGITLYGVLIPNSVYRALVVNGMLGAAAIASVVTAYWRWGMPAEDQPYMLVDVCVWIGMAVAFSVFNSARVESYRRASAEARELGQYRLGQKLGGGGMGEVFLAKHRLLKRPCAVKVIRPEKAGDPTALARFEREVQATATLTHPNAVQIFDYGHAEDGTFYYAMEYLPGLSLKELVEQHGPLPPERVVHILRQVCGALQEAHTAGLIHRDIKPGNILICNRGGLHDVAKILDFGLVKSHASGDSADQLSQEGAITGTPAFMSPEQADGQKELDARSDLYSLGCVAYYLLTGQPPFVKPTALQTLIAQICDPPRAPTELRADVPPDLQAVVLRCLEKAPQQRFASAERLEKDLAACHCAGMWTEERAASWWQNQTGSAKGMAASEEASTIAERTS